MNKPRTQPIAGGTDGFEGESRADSTPIFEGSIAAYRVDAIEEIVALPMQTIPNWPYSSAIKVFERFRIESIRFSESPITDSRNRITDSTRGQAWRISGDTVRSGSEMADGGPSSVEWLSAHHFTAFVVLGIMAGIAHASTVLLIGWFGGEPITDRLMLLIDAVILASLGIGFTGCVSFCTSAVSFLSQNIRLVQGMMMLQFGQSLHRWEASQTNRGSR